MFIGECANSHHLNQRRYNTYKCLQYESELQGNCKIFDIRKYLRRLNIVLIFDIKFYMFRWYMHVGLFLNTQILDDLIEVFTFYHFIFGLFFISCRAPPQGHPCR